MALFECHMFSKELFSSVTVNIILPTPNAGMEPGNDKARLPRDGEKYPVLYLLHGFSADCTDWLRGSAIERYAQARHLAVVMPSGGNSFYQDLPSGAHYAGFVLDELPAFVRSVFPISAKRKYNYIAGLSMGGYGAVMLALRRPSQYSAMASLSAPLTSLRETFSEELISSVNMPVKGFMEEAFGSGFANYTPETDDIPTLLTNALKAEVQVPRLYQCCGTEDPVYGPNIAFRDFARTLDFDYTFAEGPGVHDFDFWDPYIKKVIDWIDPDEGFVT